MAGGAAGKSLEQTPTWAVASVCSVFVICSLLVERLIFSLGQYLKRKNKKELFHTLEVIRNELMLLGFVSLFLAVFQPKIASICMPESWNHRMLPCPYKPHPDDPSTICPAGKVQVISARGMHELHIFIFVLAVAHVLYSGVTVLLGLWQLHSWESWENETREEHRDHTVDEALGKHAEKKASSSFVKKHAKHNFLKRTITGLNLESYIYSFFRQFGRPIYKHDYLCLRLGFIAEHSLTPAYDFLGYIRRCMEADFKVVVSIRWYLWAFVCVFLLIDVQGWYTYFWIAFIPTVTILLVGMKLQQIITSLALEVTGGVEKRHLRKRRSKPAEIKKSFHKEEGKSDPIKPRDDLFWFNRPRLLLYLVQVMLFQNAFEFAYFFWALVTYGYNSCLVGKLWSIISRLLMGLLVLILCSVSTLPLYALVSQLGSNIRMDRALSEKVVTAIHNWSDAAKKKRKDSHSDHTSDVEMPRSNEHRQVSNGESNGVHHLHKDSQSHGTGEEIREQGPAAK